MAAIGARPRRSVAIAAKAAPTTQDFIGPVQKMMRERPVYASHRVQSFTVGARWRTAGTRKIGGFNSLWTNTMNRCSKATRTTIFIASCALVASAGALFHPDARAERGFPAKTQRGEMTFTELPDVVLNGKAERLAHSVRVHDERNALVRPGHVNGRSAVVNYVRDGGGTVREVWILSEQEAAIPLKRVPGVAQPAPFGRAADYAN